MTETPAKQFSRCRLGDIVYYENMYVFITELDSRNMIIKAQGMVVTDVEVNLNDREKLTYPIPKPVPDNIIQKRNDYMYDWHKSVKNSTNTISTTINIPSNSTPTSSTSITLPTISDLLKK